MADRGHLDEVGVESAESLEKKHTRCIQWRDDVVAAHPYIQFMFEKLAKVGCKVDVGKQFECEPCPVQMAGAFDAKRHQIVLCENMLISKREVENVLRHELIHAYDHCTGKVNWNNARHLACSEIRAASLSGECSMLQEWFNRFNFGLQGQHMKCVKRKAALSMQAVGSTKFVDEAIEEVWDTCYHDTEPFDRIP